MEFYTENKQNNPKWHKKMDLDLVFKNNLLLLRDKINQ